MKELSLGIVLTLIFVVLRLCKIILWSWFWVLSPIIIETLIYLIIILVLYLIYRDK